MSDPVTSSDEAVVTAFWRAVEYARHAYDLAYSKMSEDAWPNAVRAAWPIIAAAVRAEAVADRDELMAEVTAAARRVDVYPVGLLRALKRRRWEGIKQTALYIKRQSKRRNWRAVRNTFNGYLAEHVGCAHNCGHGWTRRRATRRVEKLCRG